MKEGRKEGRKVAILVTRKEMESERWSYHPVIYSLQSLFNPASINLCDVARPGGWRICIFYANRRSRSHLHPLPLSVGPRRPGVILGHPDRHLFIPSRVTLGLFIPSTASCYIS